MISDLLRNLITSYKSFIGTGSILVLFAVAVFLIVKLKNEDDEKSTPVWILIMSVIGTIGAALGNLINSSFIDTKWKKIFVCAACVFAITISGKRIIGPDFMNRADNSMHISNDLKLAMDAVLEGDNSEQIGIVTNPGMGDYFEGYSSRFHSMFDDDFDKNSEKISDEYIKAYLEMLDKYPDMKIVSLTAKQHNCRYIVIKKNSYWPKVPLTEIGYDVFGEFGEWEVYVMEGEI